MPVMSRSTVRTVLGLVIAPLAFGVLLWIGGLASGNGAEGLWALKSAALFGYPIAIFTGIPAHLWMVKKGWIGLPTYLGLAVVYAIILPGWLFVRPALSHPDYLNLTALALQSGLVLIGCAVTLVTFWLIARPGHAAGNGRKT